MAAEMPILVKHCALAIYKSGYCQAKGVKKVQQALDIAVSRLTEYKFLWKNAGKVKPENIGLTAKGKAAEARHRRETGGGIKTAHWDALYTLMKLEAEEENKAGATTQQAGGSKELQRFRRLSHAARSSAQRLTKRTK